MKYNNLIQQIQVTHDKLYKSAVKSVNIHLTFRNLLIGRYIVEFEQKGKDRAKYGENLLKQIADKIKIKGLTAPELSRCRQFYNVYGSILGLPTQEFQKSTNERIVKHEHIGQLKTYVQYYKKYMMQQYDNPPVGILLVTDKNETLVEFAIAENDKELFVSKYALQLPKKEELKDFINNELKQL